MELEYTYIHGNTQYLVFHQVASIYSWDSSQCLCFPCQYPTPTVFTQEKKVSDLDFAFLIMEYIH